MAKCSSCNRSFWRMDLLGGVCDDCRYKAADEAAKRVCKQCGNKLDQGLEMGELCAACAPVPGGDEVDDDRGLHVAGAEESLSRIILTTESAPDLPIDRRLDIVTAEVVIGLHIFKDIATAFRDAFGGRSKVMQNGLRDARKIALDELRREAALLGADAVVAVDLDYSEISGIGKNMLFLVASGTAVTLRPPPN